MFKVLVTHYSNGRMHKSGEQLDTVSRADIKLKSGLIAEIKTVKAAETKDAESLPNKPKRKPAKRQGKAVKQDI